MLNDNYENSLLAGHDSLQEAVNREPEQGGEMNSNQANLEVKIEQQRQEAVMPELVRVHLVPNQGTIEGAFHTHQDMKPVLMEQRGSNQKVQLSGALQNPRAFLEQLSRAKPELGILPPLSAAVDNVPSMINMHQVGGDALSLQRWPLLPAPPSFGSAVQNLNPYSIPSQQSAPPSFGSAIQNMNQFFTPKQQSEATWPMPSYTSPMPSEATRPMTSTQLWGPSNPAVNYPVEGFPDMRVNSSNSENGLLQYYINQLKMIARPVDNQYPNMTNANHSAAFNYQKVGIPGGQESRFSNPFHPLPTGGLPVMLSNQVFKEEGIDSSLYHRQGTTQASSFSPPVYYNQGLVHQAGLRTELQEPLTENPRNKVKHMVKDEKETLFPTHHPRKRAMDQKSQAFLETFDDLFGKCPPSSSSFRAKRRRTNTSLYSIKSKASDFHVDPILRAFVIAMKKQGKDYRNAGIPQNIPK